MIREHAITIARTARYARLGEAGESLRQAWLVCHGYGQLASRFLRRFEPIADPTRLIVAPEALNRFYLDARPVAHGPGSPVGATWMTREDRLNEIEDYVRYLDAVHDHAFAGIRMDRVTLTVLGFSQGVSTVARWASRTKAGIDRLVLWAGSWPPELVPRPGLFGGARVILVAGTQDPAVSDEAIAKLRARLGDGGIEAEVIRFEGGHDLDDATLHALSGPREQEPGPIPGAAGSQAEP